jgi:hypothetical protein
MLQAWKRHIIRSSSVVWRKHTTGRRLDSTSLHLREAKTNVQTTEARLRSAQRLFVNDASVWPMHASRYYLRHDIHYSAVSGWAGALARVLAHSQ